MKQEYQVYFDEVVSQLGDAPLLIDPDGFNIMNLIGDQPFWRSDAYYYLYFNALHMLFGPLSVVEPQKLFEAEIRSAFKRDVISIAGRAKVIAKQRGRKYISSTTIAIALGQIAEELETISFQVWGPTLEDKER